MRSEIVDCRLPIADWGWGRRFRLLVPVLALCVLCGFAAIPSTARANGGGEAGLVIQHDDGTVETYCVAFSGDSITGDELLRRANIQVTQFGGLVCALGPQSRGEGCFQPSSVESCLCKSYPPDSTYWAFFSEPYGKSWVYSAVGYTQAKARDGDMQAWKWGKGGPSSAPAPVAISFEQVCGHGPRGGTVVALTPTATAAVTTPPSPAALGTSPVTSTPAAVSPMAPHASATPGAATPAVSSPANGSQPAATVTPVESLTIISHGTGTATPIAAAANVKDSGSNRASALAFAVVVLALAGGIVAAWTWRRRRGS